MALWPPYCCSKTSPSSEQNVPEDLVGLQDYGVIIKDLVKSPRSNSSP